MVVVSLHTAQETEPRCIVTPADGAASGQAPGPGQPQGTIGKY